MVQASGQDAAWISGMTTQEETPGQTWDKMERLCLSAGLVMPFYISMRGGGSGRGEGRSGRF